MDQRPPEAWMLIGRVAGAFGISGEAKIEPITDEPERFFNLDEVAIGPEHQVYSLEGVRLHKGHVLLRLEGIATPEEVARLRGADVMVPRAAAVTLPEGHYFLADLIGARVLTTDGQQVGAITDVLQTPANDVYVVQAGGKEILIPGIKDAVVEMDVAGKRVVIEPWVLLEA